MQLTGERNAVDTHPDNSNTHKETKTFFLSPNDSDTSGLEIKLFESQGDFSWNIIVTIKSIEMLYRKYGQCDKAVVEVKVDGTHCENLRDWIPDFADAKHIWQLEMDAECMWSDNASYREAVSLNPTG